MRRRSGAGSKALKAASHHTAVRKRRVARKTAPPRSAAAEESKIARLGRELNEALERETAAAEVLRIISASAGDLEPVFKAIAKSAVNLCGARFGAVFRMQGDLPHLVTDYNFGTNQRQLLGAMYPMPPNRGHISGRAILTRSAVQIPDIYADEDYKSVEAKKAGFRSLLAAPLLQGGRAIGSIVIYRTEPGAFTSQQLALLRTFAAQAVIAIENTRLLNELRESLQQQTATTDVLKVISSSPGELAPVFDAMLENAVGICEAKFGVMFRFDGDESYAVAMLNLPPALDEFLRTRGRRKPVPGGDIDNLRKSKQVVHTIDMLEASILSPPARLAGGRTQLAVPMLKDNVLIGAIIIYRTEVRPFNDKQIDLVQNFAAQAVIAIENTRLLSELRQSLEQQTATADVLRVISSSPGELEPVFQSLLENATRLSEAKFAMLSLYEDNEFRSVGNWNLPPAWAEFRGKNPIRFDPMIPMGRAVTTKQPVHIVDVLADQSYVERYPGMVGVAELGGARTLLQVPLLKENEVVGTIGIYRQEVRPFTDKQIDLVKNFAAQAVIAIENARLLNELRQRTNDLTQSLEDLRTAQDRLVQTEKLASLGQLTAGIAHEIKNPLNFVNNFSGLSVELVEELEGGLKDVTLDDKRRAEFGELTETLRGNLQKVVQHGKRADAIVKNMLLHSRQGSGEHRPVDVNALVEESLNLAYHGARAEKQGFEISLKSNFDPAAGAADLFPQEITRALLNLVSNGFYAATRRKAETDGGDYEPTLAAATKNLGNSVEIRIRDNGAGIPPEVREKLFTPFFTTKPAGEGTGLGLSISHDIIVKQHGGSIEVETQPGEFTEFRIVLPRAGMSLIKSG